MSIGKKLLAQSAGLAESLGKFKETSPMGANRSAPAQLMAFRGEMEVYETRIAELEKRLADGVQSEIRLANIEANPWQPRRLFDEESIKALASNIAETGLIQPVVVRSVPTRDTFQLIAGERRWRAHQQLGRETIKAVVIEATDAELAVMALAENLDREDLTDFEIGKAIRRIENEFPTKKKLAEAIGVGRQDLYKFLSFEKLPKAIQIDLETKPQLLGRNAADRIVSVLNCHRVSAEPMLDRLWKRVFTGELEQSGLVAMLEGEFSTAKRAKSEPQKGRAISVGDRVVGTFASTNTHITIKLDKKALAGKADEVLAFIKKELG